VYTCQKRGGEDKKEMLTDAKDPNIFGLHFKRQPSFYLIFYQNIPMESVYRHFVKKIVIIQETILHFILPNNIVFTQFYGG